MFLLFIKLMVLLFFIWIVSTQIISPVFENRSLFPVFRKKEGELRNEIRETNSEIAEALLAKELKEWFKRWGH